MLRTGPDQTLQGKGSSSRTTFSGQGGQQLLSQQSPHQVTGLKGTGAYPEVRVPAPQIGQQSALLLLNSALSEALALVLECACSLQWHLLCGFSFWLCRKRGFQLCGNDLVHSSVTVSTYYNGIFPFTEQCPIHRGYFVYISVTAENTALWPHFHPPPRCIISGMASGSIVLFYNDFNRWHHEYQTRYWWRQMHLGPVTRWSRKNSEHHSIEIAITSECNLNLLEQAKYF